MALEWDWEWPTPIVSMISRLRTFFMENMSKYVQHWYFSFFLLTPQRILQSADNWEMNSGPCGTAELLSAQQSAPTWIITVKQIHVKYLLSVGSTVVQDLRVPSKHLTHVQAKRKDIWTQSCFCFLLKRARSWLWVLPDSAAGLSTDEFLRMQTRCKSFNACRKWRDVSCFIKVSVHSSLWTEMLFIFVSSGLRIK